jgi:hypothetical protein
LKLFLSVYEMSEPLYNNEEAKGQNTKTASLSISKDKTLDRKLKNSLGPMLLDQQYGGTPLTAVEVGTRGGMMPRRSLVQLLQL